MYIKKDPKKSWNLEQSESQKQRIAWIKSIKDVMLQSIFLLGFGVFGYLIYLACTWIVAQNLVAEAMGTILVFICLSIIITYIWFKKENKYTALFKSISDDNK